MKLEDYLHMMDCIKAQLEVLELSETAAINDCDDAYRLYFKDSRFDRRNQADAHLKEIREKQDILYKLKRRISYQIGLLEGKR